MATDEKDSTAQGAERRRPARTHLSVTGLRARGWSPGMVRQLLGEPDLLLTNAHLPSAPRTRLYRVDRIETAERSEEFRALSAVAARRSSGVRVASQRRRREVLARIAAEPLEVPRLAPARLTVLAVAHHQRSTEEPSCGDREQPEESAPVEGAASGILARWKVDYLRHRLNRYDDVLADLRDSAGRAAAEDLLCRRVYAAVSEAYPELAPECERRVRALSERRGTGAGNSDAHAPAGAHDRQTDRRTARQPRHGPHGPQEPP